MSKFIPVAMLILGFTSTAMAVAVVPVPEIDPSAAVSALTVLTGAVLIIRGRRKI